MAIRKFERKLGNFFLWAVGIFFVVCSTSYFEGKISIYPSLLFVGAGLLLLPPIRSRLKWGLGGWLGVVLGVFMFGLGGYFVEYSNAEKLGFDSVAEYRKAGQTGLDTSQRSGSMKKVVSTAVVEKPDFTKITKTVIESDRPPFKKTVEVYLSERITKAQVAAISKDIRAEAGSGYKNVFIGFHIPNGGGMYWATGHHSPNLDARIVGMTREQYGIAKTRIDNVTLVSDEKLLAKALILGSGWARMVLILKNGDGFIERTYWLPSDKPIDQPLTQKGGKYWSREEGSTVNFRITKSKIEIHDNLGPISSGYRE